MLKVIDNESNNYHSKVPQVIILGVFYREKNFTNFQTIMSNEKKKKKFLVKTPYTVSKFAFLLISLFLNKIV